MRNPATTAVTLSAVALLALTSACGGKETATTSSSTSTSTSSSSPMASDSASSQTTDSSSPAASDTQSSSPDASASSSGGSSSGGKTFTDAQLAAMLQGVTVQGQPVSPAPVQMVQGVKSGGGSQLAKVRQTMQSATITPASCKQAMLSSMDKNPTNVPTAVSMGKGMSTLVVLRSLATADAAKSFINQARTANEACTSYTMVSKAGGQTVTTQGTTKPTPVDAASLDDDYAQTTVMTMAGQSSKSTTAVGHVGNVLVQLTYQGTAPSADQVNKDLEAVAKKVAAQA